MRFENAAPRPPERWGIGSDKVGREEGSGARSLRRASTTSLFTTMYGNSVTTTACCLAAAALGDPWGGGWWGCGGVTLHTQGKGMVIVRSSANS